MNNVIRPSVRAVSSTFRSALMSLGFESNGYARMYAPAGMSSNIANRVMRRVGKAFIVTNNGVNSWSDPNPADLEFAVAKAKQLF